jgi:hypothetical protein
MYFTIITVEIREKQLELAQLQSYISWKINRGVNNPLRFSIENVGRIPAVDVRCNVWGVSKDLKSMDVLQIATLMPNSPVHFELPDKWETEEQITVIVMFKQNESDELYQPYASFFNLTSI